MKKYISCLTIAGSDPSGGAGIEADLKTFAALGTYGMAVITAVTAQNTVGVCSSFALPEDVVAAQAEAVFEDIHPRFVKIGMIANAGIIKAVARMLQKYSPEFVVLDPVMVSTSGSKLMADDAIDSLRSELLPLASVVTPNLPEFSVLSGFGLPATVDEVKAGGKKFFNKYHVPLLIKGGHFEDSPYSTDVLVTSDEVRAYSMSRIRTENTHGTGCTLSSAITAYYARGHKLAEAIGLAKSYLFEALKAGADVKLGAGHGPVNHFFKPEKQRFE